MQISSLHLLRFPTLHDQLAAASVDEPWLREIESRDNLFPEVDWNYWQGRAAARSAGRASWPINAILSRYS